MNNLKLRWKIFRTNCKIQNLEIEMMCGDICFQEYELDLAILEKKLTDLKKQLPLYVRIIKCDSKTAWYNCYVGLTFKVTDKIFPPDYVELNRRLNKKGLWPKISFEDAEIVHLNWWKRFCRPFSNFWSVLNDLFPTGPG